jgi:tRNA 5-methylaminomethyl-2-thiouridine biosynthesis bifunctional protein
MTIEPAQLAFTPEGIPWSETYGDIYHAAAGAFAQTQHVFLAGNGLPERWREKESFVIVETGFGLGNNFLATWAAWRSDPARSKRLHFISVEKHPFKAVDLVTAHQASGAPSELSAELVRHWPLLVPGCNRLELEQGAVILTLFFGEAAAMLRQASARADAIFLDGFSPTHNPEMWSPKVFSALAGLADSKTTLATWSVSSAVREGLTRVGFAVEKKQGFSGKREMLCGRYRGERPDFVPQKNQKALVIGAGLAGTAIAERLAIRGYSVEILEAQGDAAQGASGNLAGAFRPLPSIDDNRISRITRAGFFYALQHINSLTRQGHHVLWEQCGVLHLARSIEQETKQQAIVKALDTPPEFLQWVDAKEASLRAGHTASFGGWWFPQGGWIQPASLCQANLAAGGTGITLRTEQSVATIRKEDELWLALDEKGDVIASAPQLVLANAYDARRLADAEWLPLRAARGQVSHLPMAQLAPLGVVVCGQGYITPGIGGHAALGASFVIDDFDLALREEEHAENLTKLGRMLPNMLASPDEMMIHGRVSLRPISLDRLPMVGGLPAITLGDRYNLETLPRIKGLWLITGFGARGLVWSSLCGELLASKMCGDPLPVEQDLADSLDPGRFVINPPKNSVFPAEN